MAVLVTAVPLLGVGLVARVAVRALEILFVVGVIGSALVVVITFVEDLKEALSPDEPPNGKGMERPVSTEHIHA